MHCLGAVTGGTSSPNGIGGRSGIFNVFRALGVLVCEGRIQGPPRGYKEGPHCAPPMQAVPNDHVCEEDNYLCDRYLVLIREIAEHISTGSYLCVEVLLCSDCPCGLAKSTFKYHVCPVPSLSISSWQQSSEMLLEYWFISVVPSKCPEAMNFQGLYQAVRSRLHFSQLVAWWSRSNGTDPRYVVTRIVPHNEDNLRKFREAPVEHSFPLAGNGDGNSIKVTVWALPRMEEVPILYCSLHPVKEKAEEDLARALTPTKSISVSTTTQNPESLVLPALLDDRLQTTCNRSGKHHCHCEEEDTSPPSPTIRSNGERKRRRSLPCGPAENSCVNSFQSAPLPSLQESILQETKDNQPRNSSDMVNNRGIMRTVQIKSENRSEVQTRNNLNSDYLVERCLKTQMNVEEREGKRYKLMTGVPEVANSKINIGQIEENYDSSKNSNNAGRGSNSSSDIKSTVKGRLLENFSSFSSPIPWPFVSSWQNKPMNSKFQSFRVAKEEHFNDSGRDYKALITKDTNLVIDPYSQPNPFHEQNPGPSTHNVYCRKIDNSICSVHQSCFKNTNSVTPVSTCQNALIVNKKDNIVKDEEKAGKELSQLMSKLSLPTNENGRREEKVLLDWFSKKVPGKVLNITANKSYIESKAKDCLKQSDHDNSNEIKSKNCNLELSQREFDEVLAALRTRTPTGRRRTTLRNIKRREKLLEKSGEETERVLTKCTCSESSNITSNKSCEGCAHRLCKKIDYQISVEQENAQDRVYYDKNSYQVMHTKCRTYGPNKFNGESQTILRTDTRMNENLNHLQNVSTKADVLLEAILRTSKDQKDSVDTSNGTRPRSTINIDDDSDDSHSSTEKLGQYHRLVSPYDEKSSSFVTNKRFSRLRQLFRKEEEEKKFNTTDDSSQENSPNLSQYVNPSLFSYNEQPRTYSNIKSKARRRIDFSDFSEVTQKKVKEKERKQNEEEEEEEVVVVIEEDTVFSTKNAHQKPQEHSTNRENDDQKYDSAYSCINRRNQYDRLQCTKNCTENVENENCDVLSVKEETTVHKDNSIIVPSLSGHSSSKIRCNNYKDNAVEDDETVDKSVPSALEQEKFRRSLENAASMVFHSRTGLPLTSSPAPLRRGSCCFDYDSSLNSVSSKRSALFELNTPPSPGAVSLEETDREIENVGEGEETPRRRSNSRNRPQSHALLGSFEESALNGRLEPVSTVHGFSAELGASGSFCPKHQKLPVTVFFYTLGDNDKVSTPYLAHINLEKKGYQVPRSGTIQVTLLNPLGTVVKMFVVLYDLTDMPARSHTFLRQRTLRDKTLRYLVHLRFMSSKSGRIYLHTDIRMIICRKSDVDTASDFGSEPPKELRSYTHGPTNPKFSPRC